MKQIANYITLANLFCGLMAISVLASGVANAPIIALAYMGLAAILDFLDGFVARWLGADGEMGKQLDSLADLVSFGVVPGLIWRHYMLELGFCSSSGFCINQYVWMLIPLAAAWRLARFNVQSDPGPGFVGVPTPMMGLALAAWSLIPYALKLPSEVWIDGVLKNFIYGMLGMFNQFLVWLHMPLLAAFLMVGNTRMLAFKGKLGVWHYAFLGYSVLALLVLPFAAGPLLLLGYLICSVLANFAGKQTNSTS
jgi:CDP-diacylglycerol--serine O-phosphatidyltransferase